MVPDHRIDGAIQGVYVVGHDITDLKIAHQSLKQAQEALRASESELRLIMDNVPARVAYIDRDYRYRFLNRHNEEWLGLSRNELTGRPVADVVGEERFRQMQPMLDRVLAGEVVSVEQMLAQPSGEERWESIHYAPNRDAVGSVIGIYAVHTDIHEEKQNEDALRRANWMLSSHIDNTPLAVLEWDRDFRLVRWSPQAERLFGWRADEVLGMPIDGESAAARGGPRRGRRAPRAADERRGAADDGPHAQHRKDGETIWCEWYHSCLLDDHGNIVSILSFVQDVSAADPRRRAAAAHGDARRADRPAQPRAAAGAAGAGDRAGEARRHAASACCSSTSTASRTSTTRSAIASATSSSRR